ncbi:hypothetical protein [Kitasatospora viridis]|uniref:Uncharacterized protein n=1 Tax=Kitasatospora viridis TaxID=281105 RepID=A0A561SEC5_9ACTN|nr:hypothetical protein [Kitasatospora viridis]TWF73197.1 hypothetical protein FHX73_16348 [Kitasatospora viridis]
MAYGADARELYEALTWHEGPDPYATVVGPWLDRARGGYRRWLAGAAEDSSWWAEGATGPEPGGQELLWELYALSRVSDQLLLGFDASGPTPSPHAYLDLFACLGMTPFDSGGAFDPFLHEIVEVEQTPDPYAPIEAVEVLRPGLMLGQLLFARAGVRIRAGAEHAQCGVADRSPLYWTFRRANRPTVDLSQGWGSNSQWRTDFRLDYRTPAGDRLNVAGDRPIDGNPELHPDHPANLGPEERLLTPGERRELLRHRCLLRAPEAAEALAGSPGWERELMPFDWRLRRLPDAETDPSGS